MNVISIGTERKMFSDNPTRDRILYMGQNFEQYNIIVFALKKNGFKNEKIGKAHIYSTNSSNKLLYIFDAIKICFNILKSFSEKQRNETVITAQDPFECGLVGLFVSKIKNIPLHVQIHTDIFSPFFKNTFLQYIRMTFAPFVIKRAKAIRCDSKRMTEVILNKKMSKAKIITLPIFIDTEKYNLAEEPKLDIHDVFEEKRFVILMASRLEAEKEISIAIDVFSKIISRYPKKAGLVIVGSGSLENSLKEKVKNLKLESDVKFIPWTNDLNSYYKTSDLFWMNSRFEGYGLTIAEALLSGTPVLTSDVGVAPEIVLEGKNGWICNPLDKACFEAKLDDIVSNQEAYTNTQKYLKNTPYKHLYANKEEYGQVFTDNIKSALI